MGTGLAELYREEIERTENGIEDLEIKFLNWKYDDTVTKGEVELKNGVYCVNSHFGSYLYWRRNRKHDGSWLWSGEGQG